MDEDRSYVSEDLGIWVGILWDCWEGYQADRSQWGKFYEWIRKRRVNLSFYCEKFGKTVRTIQCR